MLLAGLVAVLSRYTGEEDVALAANLTGGGTGVLRVAVEEKLSFAELVQRCLAAVVEVVQGPAVPPELLAGDPPRCPVALAVSPAAAIGAGVAFELLAAGPAGLSQDLAVQVTDVPEGFDCQVRYAADLFAPGRVEALLRHWERALHAAGRDPAVALAQLPLLDEADRAQDRHPQHAGTAAGQVGRERHVLLAGVPGQHRHQPGQQHRRDRYLAGPVPARRRSRARGHRGGGT